VKSKRIYRGPRPRDKRAKDALRRLTVEEYQALSVTPKHTWAEQKTGKVVSQSVFVRRWERFLAGAVAAGGAAAAYLSYPW